MLNEVLKIISAVKAIVKKKQEIKDSWQLHLRNFYKKYLQNL